MVFDHVEKLKREFTDQFVIVDDQVAELSRFEGHTGYVKTVNMSGRALVEFMHLENNIGWYDIDVDFLKIVDEPIAPKETEAKPAKPAATKTASKPKADAAMSVADILAAARGGGGEAKAEPSAKAAPQAEAKPAAKKMSVEEMMAAARSEKAKATPAAEVKSPPSAAEPEPETPAADSTAAASGDLPTTPAEIVAWCKQHDAS